MIELFLQILGILAPGICLALIGVGWYRHGPAFPTEFVTTLVINLALPALLFHTLATAEVDVSRLSRMALATVAVHLVFVPIAFLLLHLAGKDWRLGVAHVVGNTGNLGLPVCLFAFGAEGLAYAMAFFAVQCLLLFSLGDAVYSGRVKAMQLLRSPILYAIIAGVVVRLSELAVPAFVLQTSELLGQIVIPIMLITLGVSLAGMRTAQLPESLRWSAVRTVLAVLVGFGVAALFGLDGVARGVLILETAMPVAVFNFLLVLRHGRDSQEVSGLILVTHLGAFVYLPVLLAVLLP